jgi:murein DD-endopeptidase MepM/ murein hydrolase activator NlpD
LYTIKKGDTISSIAKSYSLDPEDISLYNGIIPDIPLEINSDIFLPGAKPLKQESKKVSKIKLQSPLSKKTTSADKLAISILNKNSKYSSLQKLAGYFINPTPSARRRQKLHGNNAVDLASSIGTPVVASASGVVSVARSSGWNYGYGQYIVISHPNGTQTVYAHLSVISVSVGQTVSQGERIGSVGNTGNSTGPHLHFGIRPIFNYQDKDRNNGYNGCIDPAPFFDGYYPNSKENSKPVELPKHFTDFQKALDDFQKAEGLKPYPLVGPQTRKALNKYLTIKYE